MATITLDEARNRIAQKTATNYDIEALTNEISYHGTDAVGSSGMLQWGGPEENKYLFFTSSSQKNFFRDLKGPDHYLLKVCDLAMQEANVDYLWSLLKEKSDRILLRCRKNDDNIIVRGVLQSTYVRFDNLEMIDCMLEEMKSMDMSVSAIVNEEDMLQMRVDFEGRDIKVGNAQYRPGLIITNSETGRYKPTVDMYVREVNYGGWIRWANSGDSLASIRKQDMTAADIRDQLKRTPATALEQIPEAEAALKHADKIKLDENPILRLHLILRGGKINDDGTILGELWHAVNYDKSSPSRLSLVQAMARIGEARGAVRMARLAGEMLVKDAVWQTNLMSKIVDGKQIEED
jgi:hypothetical protein